MGECRSSPTPVIKKYENFVNTEHNSDREMFSYRSAVGALLY